MTFNLFPPPFNHKRLRTTAILNEYKQKEITFKVAVTPKELFTVTTIFQKQLPKMPKEYIFRQVFDPKHKNHVLYKANEIRGSICYRSFYELNFVEIVFCAVDTNLQIQGYGNFMMDCFKEHVKCEYWYNKVEHSSSKNPEQNNEIVHKKAKNQDIDTMERLYTLQHNHLNVESNEKKANLQLGLNTKTFYGDTETYLKPPYKNDIIYLMTYADNYALGYFKKNGFTTKITFKNWVHCIKDYDGGTIVQSKILPQINYILKEEFIEALKKKMLNKFDGKCDMSVYDGVDPRVEIVKGLENIQPDDLICKSDINYVIKFLLSDLQNHPSAWPFLQPVKQSEVPDYYTIITNPMDLSTMQKKLERREYTTLEGFHDDFMLMINNCCIYNSPGTQYRNCAENLEEFFYKQKAVFDKD